MKRKIAFLIAAVMLLTMISRPTRLWGQVSSAAPEDGKSYVVAAYVNSKYYAMPASSLGGGAISGTEITLNAANKVNTSVASGKTWTLQEGIGTDAGTYYLKCTISNETYYLYKNGTSASNHNFAVGKTNKNYWEFTTSGTAYVVTAKGRGTNNTKVSNTSGNFTLESSGTNIILLEIGDVHTITYSATNGSIAGVDAGSNAVASGASIAEGATVTLTATPSAGYSFNGWSVSGTGASLSSTDTNPTTFTMGTANASVTATFVEAGDYININPITATPTCKKQDVEFTIDTDQDLDDDPTVFYTTSAGTSSTTAPDWIDEVLFYEGTLTVAIKQNKTSSDRTAYFRVEKGSVKSDVVSITQSAFTLPAPSFDPESGAIFINEDIVLLASDTTGATIYYTMGDTPADPTTSSSVYDPEEGIAVDASTTIKAIAVKYNISSVVSTASYTVKHVLTLPSADSYGTYTAEPASPVAAGTKVTLTYTPEEGYEDYIANWSSDDVSIAIDGTFTMPEKDVAISVTVIPNPYIKDVMTPSTVGINGSSYTSWSDKSWTSDAIYAGCTSGHDDPATMIQMRSNKSDAGIYTTRSSGIVRKVSVVWTGNSTNTDGRKLDIYGKNSAYSAVTDLYNEDLDGSVVGTITYGTSTEISINNDTVTNIGLRAQNGAIYLDKIQIFWEYVFPENEGSITHNTTIPANVTINETTVTIPVGKTLTINGILNISGALTNNGNAANLIIEDGGQLIASNSVAATVKKTIADPTKTDYGHWYTISTPVHKGATDNVVISETNLTSMGSSKYDMFYLDEAEGKWINQKASGTGFANMYVGKGYLYRNDGTDLVITGNTNYGNIDYTLTKDGSGDIAGFNLIGNPYPHDITLKHITYSKGDNLTGCYVLSNAGAWGSQLSDESTISSYQGFLVQTDVDDKVATFHETAQRGAKSNGDNIKFIVSNSQYADVTYALFDKGFGLSKINHRNADIPMLYINQNDEDYAIATMDDNTKSFNLNLKAKTTGKYTLSYKADGNFSYLHVIDRLTGEDVDMLMEGEYSFIASPSDAANRFIVRLEYLNGIENSENSIFAYQSGSDIIVNGEGELQIFDVMGRRVATQYVSGVETINLQSHGVYIFKLNEKTQKIVVR